PRYWEDCMKSALGSCFLCAWTLFVALGAEAAIAAERLNILFCIADDWSYPHASIYGDAVVRTPTFDRIAREGTLFTNCYCAAPSCTPSRAAILTGRFPHSLEEGANLWGFLPARYVVYPDLLEQAGYHVGHTGKGWAPGNFQAGGRARNPAGPAYKSFAQFLDACPRGKPFCFWFGSTHPHRPYKPGSGRQAGLSAALVTVPPFWPDRPEVRHDLLDYYAAVQQFDQQLAELVAELEKRQLYEHTLIVVTSDNGMPFPRAKANLYDCGTRMPLAIRWPKVTRPGSRIEQFVSHTDLAPTFLEAAGVPPPAQLHGRSLKPLLQGNAKSWPDAAFTERERHAYVREGNLSYPARAIRTERYLYIRNFRPDRWPAGDPQLVFAVGPFGDIDDGPTKRLILTGQNEPQLRRYFELACAKRPAEELYDLKNDPHQMHNVADKPEYAEVKRELAQRLHAWMKATGDPRAVMDDDRFDKVPYFGNPAKKEKPAP
ncbi:MAG: sulfatase, partial [Gemmatales bacterium]|nr:sulfatase [Gemmatales bacterium]